MTARDTCVKAVNQDRVANDIFHTVVDALTLGGWLAGKNEAGKPVTRRAAPAVEKYLRAKGFPAAQVHYEERHGLLHLEVSGAARDPVSVFLGYASSACAVCYKRGLSISNVLDHNRGLGVAAEDRIKRAVEWLATDAPERLDEAREVLLKAERAMMAARKLVNGLALPYYNV